MERRLMLAIALAITLILLSNVIFPPIETPGPIGSDSTAVATSPQGAPAARPSGPGAAAVTPREDSALLPQDEAAALLDAQEADPEASRGEIVTVRSDLYEYSFDTRGARLVGVHLPGYPNFAADDASRSTTELVREGDHLLSHRFAFGGDTVSIAGLDFTPSTRTLDVTAEGSELTFTSRIGQSPVRITYRFAPDDYHFDVEGRVDGLGSRGHTVLLTLGRGMRSNEAVPREDHAAMALVTRSRVGGIDSEQLDGVDVGERILVSGGPFSWAASKSKYFLVAAVSDSTGPGFAGVFLDGVDEDDAADMEVALPVQDGNVGFHYIVFAGPQDFGRLRAIGQQLHNVNPFGWRWLQWFIRPFGNVVIAVLVWMHGAFDVAYGWVLILFGVVSRIVLFPLYQISMRQQMKQMAVQPEIKKIQTKHKDDPQKLQQEMMGIYKEHGINPLGGCLPMLLPFPILITLFFVFQNTIEFRGVPFLWLPDLSLKDPIYVVPLLMGGSMMLLNWIGQRGMESNPQMKVMTYVLPVVFTFMFAQFASGLNLYYAASNVASLPQQLYLSKERQRARSKTAGGKPDDGGGGSKSARGSGKERESGRERGAARKKDRRR